MTARTLNPTPTPSVPPPPQEMTMPEPEPTTRDRIRRAVCEAEGFGWDTDMLEPDEYGEVADAVLAVLPAAAGPCDRCEWWETTHSRVRDALEVQVVRVTKRAAQADETTDANRLALSLALGLGTGAPWDAIRDRAAVLRERADFYEGVLRDSLSLESDPRYCTAIHDVVLGLRRLADEAQQGEAVAHPPRTEWIAEFSEGDAIWEYFGTSDDRAVIDARLAHLVARNPEAVPRTVRKVTTYTVEAEGMQR